MLDPEFGIAEQDLQSLNRINIIYGIPIIISIYTIPIIFSVPLISPVLKYKAL